jgi:hypothetical protein
MSVQMTVVEKINLILALIKEIQETDVVIGDTLMVNFDHAIKTLQAINTGTPVDINEQLKLVTELLGIDLEQLIKTIIENDYAVNQGGDFVNSGEAEQATIDFIVGNSQNINNTNNNIDDYEKFLARTKEDMEFLKGEI